MSKIRVPHRVRKAEKIAAARPANTITGSFNAEKGKLESGDNRFTSRFGSRGGNNRKRTAGRKQQRIADTKLVHLENPSRIVPVKTNSVKRIFHRISWLSRLISNKEGLALAIKNGKA